MDTSNDSTDGNKKDENEMLDWRIYPTSVKATSKDPLDLNNAAGSVDISGISGSNTEISGSSSQQFLSRTEREDVDLGKDYYIDGQNTQLIFFEKKNQLEEGKGPPNHTKRVDFLTMFFYNLE